MAQKITDLIVSVLATLAAVLLSWPFWVEHLYWAESVTAWQVYIVVGFVLAAYVFYVFLGSLRFLFSHAEDEKREAACQERCADGHQEAEQ